jgi:hypothetical protein
MVHELFSIENNRVDLRTLGSKARASTSSTHTAPYTPAQIAKDNQELVLSAEQDTFFRSQMYSNYGE